MHKFLREYFECLPENNPRFSWFWSVLTLAFLNVLHRYHFPFLKFGSYSKRLSNFMSFHTVSSCIFPHNKRVLPNKFRRNFCDCCCFFEVLTFGDGNRAPCSIVLCCISNILPVNIQLLNDSDNARTIPYVVKTLVLVSLNAWSKWMVSNDQRTYRLFEGTWKLPHKSKHNGQ